MSIMGDAATPLFLPPATTGALLLGDRFVCSFCGLAEHAVEFTPDDDALCEDCRDHPPNVSKGPYR